VHDAISAEKLGIPAAGVITDRFTSSARVMADFAGLPGYPVVSIPHPISNNTDDEMRAKAEEAARQVVAILQSPLRGTRGATTGKVGEDGGGEGGERHVGTRSSALPQTQAEG